MRELRIINNYGRVSETKRMGMSMSMSMGLKINAHAMSHAKNSESKKRMPCPPEVDNRWVVLAILVLVARVHAPVLHVDFLQAAEQELFACEEQ